MKHFDIPFVSRRKHCETLNKLDSRVGDLQNKLKQAERELEEYRSAQRGDCVKSAKCKSCKHCLSFSEHVLYYSAYIDAECEFDLPQCQHYSPKG